MPELGSVGNVKPSAAGGQVRLDVDLAAELGIESGVWTPAIGGSAANPSVTYTSRSGAWQRIGNLVVARCELVTSAISGGSGNLLITGLPLPSAASQPALVMARNLAGTRPQVIGFLNGAAITLYEMGIGQNYAALPVSAWAATSAAYCAVTYLTP